MIRSEDTKPPLSYSKEDFEHSPFVMFYETTRACDLLCKHCRACAQPHRHPSELSPLQAKRLLQQIMKFPKPPVLVFTGGDPLKRDDIYELVEHATEIGLRTALTPSATPLVTYEAVKRLMEAGIGRLALSLDGADAEVHDSFRGVQGSYERTMQILANAGELGLPTQINTTITRHNVHQVDAIAERLASLGIVLWSVFFLIPVGRGLAEHRITPEEYEEVFEKLWIHSMKQPYGIKTTEAHHYRRFVLQRQGEPQHQPVPLPGRIQRAPLGVNDGRGVMFVSHTGSIYPSGFMPIRCGRFPEDSVVQVYQESPLFRSLRNADRFKGKCGVCDYRQVCGGSRARAYAVTRDPLAAEPDCVYIPPAWKEMRQSCLV